LIFDAFLRSLPGMRTYSARLLTVAPNPAVFPPPGPPEVAVVGRSNSGKSTLINTLMGVKQLARVSQRPGKTRAVVFFEVEERFRLVDLPGYGYARAPKQEQQTWAGLIDSYLGGERLIVGVITLFDIRREPDDRDFMLIEMLNRYDRAWQAVWTKADKLKKREIAGRASRLDRLLETPREGIAFSSKTRLGREALIEWMEDEIAG
jgi:GTP-binding protein